MSFITVKNVWQQYADQVVLEGLNLSVNEGEFCTLVGASGCGKSTFLRLLLGQETASRGEILLDGQALASEPDASRGVVFQRYSVFPHLTVLQNVMLGRELRDAKFTARLFGAARRAAADDAALVLGAARLLADRLQASRLQQRRWCRGVAHHAQQGGAH